jgi:hypothetical protein
MSNHQHATICKNCNLHFVGNFCSHCGQAAATHRLSLHYIWHDLQHGLFHFDNGLIYTTSQLLTRPGYTIREFINGKRIRHFKPFSFVVVLATLYGVLYHYFIGNIFNDGPIHPEDGLTSVYEKVIGWVFDHYAYASLIFVLTTTVASYGVFKKQGYNFAEHLVLNTFLMGLVLLFLILTFPVLYVEYKNGPEELKNYAPIYQVGQFALMYWCYAQFYDKLTWLQSLGNTVLTFVFMSAINTAIGFAAGWLVGLAS